MDFLQLKNNFMLEMEVKEGRLCPQIAEIRRRVLVASNLRFINVKNVKNLRTEEII